MSGRVFAQKPETTNSLRPSSRPALRRSSFAAAEILPVRYPDTDVRRDLWRVPGQLQAKLEVGAVDDPLEREADRIANEVASASPAMGNVATPSPGAKAVQRKCAACEDDESMHRKAVDAAGAAAAITEAPTYVHDVLRSSGRPLDAAARAFMELRLGHGFGDVRIHDDARANQSARDVRARAYTVGSDVVFGTGQYRPQTAEGRKLLAHELTHVVQQNIGHRSVQRAPTEAPLDPVSAKMVATFQQAASLLMGQIRGSRDPLLQEVLQVHDAVRTHGGALRLGQDTLREMDRLYLELRDHLSMRMPVPPISLPYATGAAIPAVHPGVIVLLLLILLVYLWLSNPAARKGFEGAIRQIIRDIKGTLAPPEIDLGPPQEQAPPAPPTCAAGRSAATPSAARGVTASRAAERAQDSAEASPASKSGSRADGRPSAAAAEGRAEGMSEAASGRAHLRHRQL